MSSRPPRPGWRLSGEGLVVIALTVAGAFFRLWAPGRLGLVHFDEGIYALAGFWCYSPRGLAGIDPAVISYAPPGFPVLVGLSYLVLGVNDLAVIMVSIVAGTLTIPLAAWLARRSFGPGAGGAAAAFTALSGPHVAFSRMALTDVSFLLFWLAALGLGQRFLERPTPVRAVALGGAVGLAQLFKYNGWLSGAIVILSALFAALLRRGRGPAPSIASTWGWGAAAAFVAAVVYWPWFGFVDSHGGYGALLAHQRNYLGGLSSWTGHLALQLAEREFLSGGPFWLAMAGGVAALGMSISRGDLAVGSRRLPRIAGQTLGLTALCLIPGISWWVGLVWLWLVAVRKRGTDSRSAEFLLIGWFVLSVLTPFYRPYARLWLPVEAIGWLLMAGAFVEIGAHLEAAGRGARSTWNRTSDLLPWFVMFSIMFAVITLIRQPKHPRMNLLGPSDSLRRASSSVLTGLPREARDLRAYARPPLLYYMTLAGGVSLERRANLAQLLEQPHASSWAVLDLALIRQENIPEKEMDRMLAGWEVVREIPTTLNAPTLLDIDPAAALGEVFDASAPVWLLRPVRTEDVR